MTLRSRATGSVRPSTVSAVSPSRSRCRAEGAPGRRLPLSAGDEQDRGCPAPRERRGQRLDPRPSGATTARAGPGTMARSPGSRASKAGIAGLQHPHPVDLPGARLAG